MTNQLYPEIQETVVLAEGISFEDYLVQYEGQSTEWHAGKVVQKVSNNTRHQMILLFLSTLLTLFLSSKKSGKVFLAGLPMYINDDVPAREPDLIVMLNSQLERVKSNRLEGPADIAVEIVSPGSGTEDRATKLFEYENAGVPEYWLIDPIRKEASIYILNVDGKYERQPEDDQNRLQSTVLDGFAFDATILWQDELPEGINIMPIVETML